MVDDHPVVNPSDLPVRTYDPIQQVQVASGGIRNLRIVDLADDLLVVRVDKVPPELRIFIESRGRQSPDPLEGRIDVQDLRRIRLRKPHALVEIVGEIVESLFARKSRAFRPPVFPDLILQPRVGLGQVGRAFGDALFQIGLRGA